MSGLVAYGSSDEEEDEQLSDFQISKTATEDVPVSSFSTRNINNDPRPNGHTIARENNAATSTANSVEPYAPVVGPAMGPARGPTDDTDTSVASPITGEDASQPLSPYSANRALIHQLTVPPLPNLDIPSSPPGSPNANTNAKFAHFLELKRKGVHFNDKLAKSSALKNPSLMEKLMDFAEIDESGQYENTLPNEFWNPRSFPDWAYKEELSKSQQKILKQREDEKTRGQRESVEFVPATITASGDSSRSGTPATIVGRVGPKSAAERVMAGLERGRSNSPSALAGTKRKTRFES